MADTDMSIPEREAFLADLHVGILSIARDGKGPLALPVWYRYRDGEVSISMDDGSEVEFEPDRLRLTGRTAQL